MRIIYTVLCGSLIVEIGTQHHVKEILVSLSFLFVHGEGWKLGFANLMFTSKAYACKNELTD